MEAAQTEAEQAAESAAVQAADLPAVDTAVGKAALPEVVAAVADLPAVDKETAEAEPQGAACSAVPTAPRAVLLP